MHDGICRRAKASFMLPKYAYMRTEHTSRSLRAACVRRAGCPTNAVRACHRSCPCEKGRLPPRAGRLPPVAIFRRDYVGSRGAPPCVSRTLPRRRVPRAPTWAIGRVRRAAPSSRSGASPRRARHGEFERTVRTPATRAIRDFKRPSPSFPLSLHLWRFAPSASQMGTASARTRARREPTAHGTPRYPSRPGPNAGEARTTPPSATLSSAVPCHPKRLCGWQEHPQGLGPLGVRLAKTLPEGAQGCRRPERTVSSLT